MHRTGWITTANLFFNVPSGITRTPNSCTGGANWQMAPESLNTSSETLLAGTQVGASFWTDHIWRFFCETVSAPSLQGLGTLQRYHWILKWHIMRLYETLGFLSPACVSCISTMSGYQTSMAQLGPARSPHGRFQKHHENETPAPGPKYPAPASACCLGWHPRRYDERAVLLYFCAVCSN